MRNIPSNSPEARIYHGISESMRRTDAYAFREWVQHDEVVDMIGIARDLFPMSPAEENVFVNILYASAPYAANGKKMVRDYYHLPHDPLPDYPSPLEILQDYSRMRNYPFFVHSASFGILFDKLMGYRDEDTPAINVHEEDRFVEEECNDFSLHIKTKLLFGKVDLNDDGSPR